MILDYTAPIQKDFPTKSEQILNNLLIIADKLYIAGLKDSSLWDEFNNTFIELFHESEKDNFYWLHCPPKVYINNYRNRESEFLKNNMPFNVLTFAKREKDFYSKMVKENSYPFLYKVANWKDARPYYSGRGFDIYNIDSSGLISFLKVATHNKIKFLDEIIFQNQNELIIENKYIIKSDDLIHQVYDICESAFDCGYPTFRKSIETANFRLLNIKKFNRVKDLTFRLSGNMGTEWYSDVCNKMNWRKSDCSGQGQKVENLKETKQLDKILPRLKK